MTASEKGLLPPAPKYLDRVCQLTDLDSLEETTRGNHTPLIRCDIKLLLISHMGIAPTSYLDFISGGADAVSFAVRSNRGSCQ